MQNQHNIFQYVAKANPKGANALINSYGYESGRTPEEITMYLSELALREKESFLKDLMKVHPDKPMLEEYVDEFNSPRSMSDYANCDGGDCKCKGDNHHAKRSDYGYDFGHGATYRGGDGDEMEKSISNSFSKIDLTINATTLVFFTFGVLVGAVVFSKK